MAELFNIDEIFEVACEIERNGARFYLRASEIATKPAVRELLARLARMEQEHEEQFTELRRIVANELEGGTGKSGLARWGGAPPDEVVLYLRAIAGGYVIKRGEDPAGVLDGEESEEEVLRTAIRLEKDSIAFYCGIQAAMPERLGRGKVALVIGEEMGHVAILSEQLKAVRGR